jgi:Ca-activated chloride channel homolog
MKPIHTLAFLTALACITLSGCKEITSSDEITNQQNNQANQAPDQTPLVIRDTPAVIADSTVSVLNKAEAPEMLFNMGDAKAKSYKWSGNATMNYNASPGYFGTTSPLSTGADYDANTEEYDGFADNAYKEVRVNPLSTFSADVDAASYSNVRRFLQNGQMPGKDAVRIEEMINYFDYDYPQPKSDDPFSITTEMADCPWNPKHKLVHIGLQGKKIDLQNLKPSNLVFLIDVSGSMQDANKLPLVKKSLRLLVENMGRKDIISIVTYAGSSGVILPPTPAYKKDEIIGIIENLEAAGSTAGSAGIETAYKLAKDNFLSGGNNRVILATDGDFNVGISNNTQLENLIVEKRNQGIFLTVLGYGMGNYKDNRLEMLADKGNGNYAYIDNLMEAQKVLVNEMGATLHTIAKDVKLQVEFNPAKVYAYRLVGYENRVMKNEDFNDDTKDAGEMGAGHNVTALYEIVPIGEKVDLPKVDDLQYQKNESTGTFASTDALTIKLRYKEPEGTESKLLSQTVSYISRNYNDASETFRFSASVAEWGMLLRNSYYKGNATYDHVLAMAQNSKGKDEKGYRSEFIRLIELSKTLAGERKEDPRSVEIDN